MDILSAKILDVDTECFCISPSIENPFVYSRFKAKIIKRDIENDNITYFVKIIEILESKEYIKRFIHRHTLRMWHLLANRGNMKKISCFDLLQNMTTFNRMFSERYKNLVIPLSSVFCFEDEIVMNEYLLKTVDIMSNHFKESQEILQERINLL